ncbi:MAG TPA: hypothetical protein VF692_00515 [Pyrinomonadaceae bacterium]|jgi:hypothetical protein
MSNSFGIKERDETPFCKLIDHAPEKRIYTFQPDEQPFLISVDLKSDDYGAGKIELAGKADTEILVAAILFVEKNELRYAELQDTLSDMKGYEEKF